MPGLKPEPFEVIKSSHGLIKNMNYYIIKIKQHPMTFSQALHTHGFDPPLNHSFLDVAGYPLNMPSGTSGTDNKIVGIGNDFINLVYCWVLGLMSSRHLSTVPSGLVLVMGTAG